MGKLRESVPTLDVEDVVIMLFTKETDGVENVAILIQKHENMIG